jgi:hypothetical protein
VVFRITVIRRIIITEETLRASLALKSTASTRLLGSTDTRLITSHAAILGSSRIVDAVGVLLAGRRRLGAEPSTRRVFVLEVTEAVALVQVFAVGQNGLAFAVGGTRGQLATAALAVGLGCGGKADGGSKEDILEQHVGFSEMCCA